MSHDKWLKFDFCGAFINYSKSIFIPWVALEHPLVVKIHFDLERSAFQNFTSEKTIFQKATNEETLRKLALNQSETGVNNMYISVFREYINPTV